MLRLFLSLCTQNKKRHSSISLGDISIAINLNSHLETASNEIGSLTTNDGHSFIWINALVKKQREDELETMNPLKYALNTDNILSIEKQRYKVSIYTQQEKTD